MYILYRMIYPGESTEAKLPATSLTQNTTSTRNHRSKVLSRDQKVCDSLKPIPIPMKLRLAGPVSLEAIQNIRQNIQLLHGSLLEPTRNHKVETYHTIRKLPLESLSSALNCTESVIVSSDVIPLHMHSDISVAMESVDEDVIMSDEIVSEESLDERFVYSDEYGDINQNDDISDVTKRSEHIEKIDEKTTTTAISIQSPQQVTNSQPFSVQSMLIHKQTETPLATYPTQSTTTRATSKRPVTIEQQVDLSGLTFARLKQLTGHY